MMTTSASRCASSMSRCSASSRPPGRRIATAGHDLHTGNRCLSDVGRQRGRAVGGQEVADTTAGLDPQASRHARSPQVAAEHQHGPPAFGIGRGKIRHRGGLPVAHPRRRDQNDVPVGSGATPVPRGTVPRHLLVPRAHKRSIVLLGPVKHQGGSQRSVCFRVHRVRLLGNDHLAAALRQRQRGDLGYHRQPEPCFRVSAGPQAAGRPDPAQWRARGRGLARPGRREACAAHGCAFPVAAPEKARSPHVAGLCTKRARPVPVGYREAGPAAG